MDAVGLCFGDAGGCVGGVVLVGCMFRGRNRRRRGRSAPLTMYSSCAERSQKSRLIYDCQSCYISEGGGVTDEFVEFLHHQRSCLRADLRHDFFANLIIKKFLEPIHRSLASSVSLLVTNHIYVTSG